MRVGEEVEEAMEEGEIEGEVGQEEEVVVAVEEATEEGEMEAMEEGEMEGEVGQEAEGNGDAGRREEYGAGDRNVWKKKKLQQQPRTPVAAESRASWKGKGGGFHHRPWNFQHYKLNVFNKPGVYGGAIIICNPTTKQEFFQQKLFGLPGYATTFIKKIRAGMLLFVFEHEERKLYGVFEATSDGALNILPNAFTALRKSRPAQVLFRRVWFCKPLTEAAFSGAINSNCLQPQMSFFGISYQQVCYVKFM
ncbi:hypothetical protein ABZP36_010870 [Zizania latifolia]